MNITIRYWLTSLGLVCIVKSGLSTCTYHVHAIKVQTITPSLRSKRVLRSSFNISLFHKLEPSQARQIKSQVKVISKDFSAKVNANYFLVQCDCLFVEQVLSTILDEFSLGFYYIMWQKVLFWSYKVFFHSK